MGARTATDFIAEPQRLFGLPSSSTIWGPSVLLGFLNNSYLVDICASVAVPELTDELQATVPAGTVMFPIDMVNYLRINDVIRVEDSYVVRPADSLNVAQLGGNLPTAQPGSIEYWYIVGDGTNVFLRVFNPPAIDTDLLLLRNFRPPALGPTVNTILHEMFDDALQGFLNARVANELRNYADGDAWFKIATNRLQRAVGKDTYGTKVMRTLNAAGSVGDRSSNARSA